MASPPGYSCYYFLISPLWGVASDTRLWHFFSRPLVASLEFSGGPVSPDSLLDTRLAFLLEFFGRSNARCSISFLWFTNNMTYFLYEYLSCHALILSQHMHVILIHHEHMHPVYLLFLMFASTFKRTHWLVPGYCLGQIMIQRGALQRHLAT